MNSPSDRADQEWLRSLGLEDELIDSLEGTRVIRSIFGDGTEECGEATMPDVMADADHGFACVA